MEKQDTFRNVLLAAAAFVAIMAIGPALLPQANKPPLPPTSETGPPDVAKKADDGRAAATEAGSAEHQIPAKVSTSGTGGWKVIEADGEAEVFLGAAEGDGTDRKAPPPAYRARLRLSNVGASVTSATLTDHAARVGKPDRYQVLASVTGVDGRVHRSFAVEKINVDGVDVSLSDKRWQVGGVVPLQGDEATAEARGEQVSFHVEVQESGSAGLRITRTFALPQQGEESGRHDLWSSLTIENLSEGPHLVVLSYLGGVGIPSEERQGVGRFIDCAARDGAGYILGSRRTDATIRALESRRGPLFSLSAETPNQRLSWVATDNTYFTCTMAPVEGDGRTASSHIGAAYAQDLDGDAATTDDTTVVLVTTPMVVDGGQRQGYRTAHFLGEKDARAFRGEPDYLERNYYYQIAQGFGWCTFTWLVELMVWLLNGLFFIVRDFGVAIIILVLIVRALLHPITKKGQVNMVRMQKRMGELSPKIEEIKRKFANDKARQQQETMRVYRESGVSPGGQMLTCLPMLIQMPIWVALYLSLSNNILMRHEPLHGTWIRDLTAPDAIYAFASPLTIPLFGWPLAAFNLLPILVAVFMYVQQKTQPQAPPSPNMSEQQRQQQDMMKTMTPMMSVMMLLIFYNMPAGLNLYVMCSSMFGWLEQKRIRKHIKDQEEGGTPQTTAAPKPPGGGVSPTQEKRKPSWIERIAKMAEDAQKAQRTQRSGRPGRKK